MKEIYEASIDVRFHILMRDKLTRRRPPWQVERKLLTKADEGTDAGYGCKPEERQMEDYVRLGIIGLDKTAGPSSHETTAWVKRILGLGLAGHGGTLEAAA